MGFDTAFESYNNYQQELVAQSTFGHLAPTKNITYKGEILFCKSQYESGRISLIATKFDTMDDSPWIYDAIHGYINKFWDSLEYGDVYRINATIRNYRFWGKPIKVYSLNKTNS